MKKLGLRALAGGLALLMVAGLGTPAAATAQDDLLILAPAQELKVLEITKDMVDEDGEKNVEFSIFFDAPLVEVEG